MIEPRRRRRLLVGMKRCLLASAAAAAVPALAQEADDTPPPAPQVSAGAATAKVYTPADFTRFAPRTALDMLRQVPGFVIERPEDRRGLGDAGGNVLINGRRISGKSNDAVTELGRIPARNVSRIEIVDGATLDIPGLTGDVANVIAELGATSGQFTWRPEFRSAPAEPMLLRGEASVSGSSGPVGYTIGIRNDAFRFGGKGPGFIFGPDGSIVQERRERGWGGGDRPKLSGSFNYEGSEGSIANLNLSYERFWFENEEVSERSGLGQADSVRRVRTTDTEYSYEVGGDYETALGGGRLKLIGLHQFEEGPFATRAVTSFADASPGQGDRFTRSSTEKESIGRAEYRWKSGVADWQIAAEGAFNTLDNISGLFTLLPSGEFVEVPLPGGSARVEERRGEVGGTYGRPLSPSVTIQASLGAEYSRLSVFGGEESSRTFYRPKGFLSAAWKASPRLDLNGKIERKVGQLNFFDFLASANLQNNNRNAGNPEIVPPQSWETELSANRNLGAYGSTTVRVFGLLFSDVVDQIPIGEAGESPGNLDSATIYGIENRTTLLFDPIGWNGAKLDMRLNFVSSSLEDPLTGELRPISGNTVRNIELSLRHDVPGTNWAWGGNFNQNRNARSFRLGEIVFQREGPVFGSVFAENKNVLGLTVRAAAVNILGTSNFVERLVFTGRRTGPIEFLEQRRRSGGPFLSLSISGSI